MIEQFWLNWRGVECFKQLFGFLPQLGFHMFLDVFVIFCLIVGFFVKILENFKKLWRESILEVANVLSEPHVYTLVNSAQLFEPFGCIVINLDKLLIELLRVVLQLNQTLVLIESAIDLLSRAIWVATRTVQSIHISLLFGFKPVVISDDEGTTDF